jgi:hypothetical protein
MELAIGRLEDKPADEFANDDIGIATHHFFTFARASRSTRQTMLRTIVRRVAQRCICLPFPGGFP